MKKIFVTIVFLVVAIASGMAQEKLKVGDMKNGKLIITDPKALETFLMNSLEKSGTLGKEYKFSFAPEGDRVFLYYSVARNATKVSNIGIMLVIINNQVFIVEGPESTPGGPGAGGSFEVQCFGSCPTCLPNIKWINGNWLPVVYCDCTQGNSGECSMITKVIVHINVGF